MYSRALLLLTILFFGTIVLSQDLRLSPKYKTIIDTSIGRSLLDQRSRAVPKNINAFWKIQQADLKVLENNFKKIYKVKSLDCCRVNLKVDDLTTFAFQLLGVFFNGRKYIYCNAFRVYPTDDIEENHKGWLTEPIAVWDGGHDFWGVLFDIKNKTFKKLAFNGE